MDTKARIITIKIKNILAVLEQIPTCSPAPRCNCPSSWPHTQGPYQTSHLNMPLERASLFCQSSQTHTHTHTVSTFDKPSPLGFRQGLLIFISASHFSGSPLISFLMRVLSLVSVSHSPQSPISYLHSVKMKEVICLDVYMTIVLHSYYSLYYKNVKTPEQWVSLTSILVNCNSWQVDFSF